MDFKSLKQSILDSIKSALDDLNKIKIKMKNEEKDEDEDEKASDSSSKKNIGVKRGLSETGQLTSSSSSSKKQKIDNEFRKEFMKFSHAKKMQDILDILILSPTVVQRNILKRLPFVHFRIILEKTSSLFKIPNELRLVIREWWSTTYSVSVPLAREILLKIMSPIEKEEEELKIIGKEEVKIVMEEMEIMTNFRNSFENKFGMVPVEANGILGLLNGILGDVKKSFENEPLTFLELKKFIKFNIEYEDNIFFWTRNDRKRQLYFSKRSRAKESTFMIFYYLLEYCALHGYLDIIEYILPKSPHDHRSHLWGMIEPAYRGNNINVLDWIFETGKKMFGDDDFAVTHILSILKDYEILLIGSIERNTMKFMIEKAYSLPGNKKVLLSKFKIVEKSNSNPSVTGAVDEILTSNFVELLSPESEGRRYLTLDIRSSHNNMFNFAARTGNLEHFKLFKRIFDFDKFMRSLILIIDLESSKIINEYPQVIIIFQGIIRHAVMSGNIEIVKDILFPIEKYFFDDKKFTNSLWMFGAVNASLEYRKEEIFYYLINNFGYPAIPFKDDRLYRSINVQNFIEEGTDRVNYAFLFHSAYNDKLYNEVFFHENRKVSTVGFSKSKHGFDYMETAIRESRSVNLDRMASLTFIQFHHIESILKKLLLAVFENDNPKIFKERHNWIINYTKKNGWDINVFSREELKDWYIDNFMDNLEITKYFKEFYMIEFDDKIETEFFELIKEDFWHKPKEYGYLMIQYIENTTTSVDWYWDDIMKQFLHRKSDYKIFSKVYDIFVKKHPDSKGRHPDILKLIKRGKFEIIKKIMERDIDLEFAILTKRYFLLTDAFISGYLGIFKYVMKKLKFDIHDSKGFLSMGVTSSKLKAIRYISLITPNLIEEKARKETKINETRFNDLLLQRNGNNINDEIIIIEEEEEQQNIQQRLGDRQRSVNEYDIKINVLDMKSNKLSTLYISNIQKSTKKKK